jgi:hypothetical protein
MHQPLQLATAGPDGHLQRVQSQVGAQRPRGLPAHDEAAEGVDDEGHIDEPGPGRHVGEVRHPQLGRPGRREVPLHQVRGSGGGRIRRGGPPGLATADALKAQLTHQPFHGAAGHRDPLPVQLPPDLPGAVDPEVLGMHPGDLDLQLGIAGRTRRGGSAAGGVVGGRGDRQHLADRLDPEPVLVTVDVGDHLGGSAVELRPEENRRGLEDLIGPPKLAVLPLQRLQPLALVTG